MVVKVSHIGRHLAIFPDWLIGGILSKLYILLIKKYIMLLFLTIIVLFLSSCILA